MSRSPSRDPATSPLWVITSYFNPARYRRRLLNYRRFRERLRAPLVTVEMSTGDPFALGRGDADRLIQVAGGDVMWQKERLINHALSSLPRHCRYVAWVDADLLFTADAWIADVEAALDRVAIVQPFASVAHAPPDTARAPGAPHTGWLTQPSVGAAIAAGVPLRDILRGVLSRTGGSAASGMAWAARRDVIDRHGLFDASIVGGGDTALVCAAFGMPELAMELHEMNGRQREVYRAWAGPFFASVRGAVGHTAGRVVHLWHGDLGDRRPAARHLGLRPYDFDPSRDIAVGDRGAWRWASDKPGLHAYLRDYFASRHEDGRARPRA
jgi:hypothetical protein